MTWIKYVSDERCTPLIYYSINIRKLTFDISRPWRINECSSSSNRNYQKTVIGLREFASFCSKSSDFPAKTQEIPTNPFKMHRKIEIITLLAYNTCHLRIYDCQHSNSMASWVYACKYCQKGIFHWYQNLCECFLGPAAHVLERIRNFIWSIRSPSHSFASLAVEKSIDIQRGRERLLCQRKTFYNS